MSAIPFEQAIEEISNGGQLFSEAGETQHVDGLKQVFVLRDAALAKAMAADVARVKKREMTVDQFKAKHADHLNVLIDPDHPDLGPKNNQFVVLRDGKLIPVDSNDATKVVEGDLFVATEVKGIPVKTAFQLVKEEAFAKTLNQYSAVTGTEVRMIQTLARELTSHGKKATIDFYRGPVQHTNGYYTAQGIITLNLLIGNPDWKGCLSIGGGHWHEDSSKDNAYKLKSSLHPGKLAAFGPPLSREKSKYEESTLFERDGGYPAKRPWYPFSGNIYQEVIPSAFEGYPYPIKILFLHKGTPALATPGGQVFIEMLQDTETIPLFISCDIVIGETSMYADYIIPDLSYIVRNFFGDLGQIYKSTKRHMVTITQTNSWRFFRLKRSPNSK